MFYTSIDESYDSYLDSSDIVANEDYRSVDSFAQTLVDIEQNNYALFEGLIMADFKELAAVKSGRVSESEIVAFREGTISDVWNKIKEMFKKLWEKVKAIFNHFLAFISGVFIRDNKKLVALWSDKIAAKDLSKLKVSWRELKHNPSTVASSLKTNVEAIFDLKKLMQMEKSDASGFKDNLKNAIYKDDIDKAFNAKEDYFFGKATSTEYTKVDSEVRECLLSGKEPLKEVKDTHKDLEKLMKECISDVDSFAKEAKDMGPTAASKKVYGYEVDDNDNTNVTINTAISDSAKAVSKAASEIQSGVTKTTNLCVSTLKKYMAQCRAAFLKAAHYNPKNESAFDDIDARVLYEDTMYEIDSDYDSFCYE